MSSSPELTACGRPRHRPVSPGSRVNIMRGALALDQAEFWRRQQGQPVRHASMGGQLRRSRPRFGADSDHCRWGQLHHPARDVRAGRRGRAHPTRTSATRSRNCSAPSRSIPVEHVHGQTQRPLAGGIARLEIVYGYTHRYAEGVPVVSATRALCTGQRRGKACRYSSAVAWLGHGWVADAALPAPHRTDREAPWESSRGAPRDPAADRRLLRAITDRKAPGSGRSPRIATCLQARTAAPAGRDHRCLRRASGCPPVLGGSGQVSPLAPARLLLPPCRRES